jgi:hypothetical protein
MQYRGRKDRREVDASKKTLSFTACEFLNLLLILDIMYLKSKQCKTWNGDKLN